MKYLIISALLIVKAGFVLSQDMISPSAKADSILIKVSEKLKTLKNIRYDHIRELNYSSENYQNISKWMVYYDFQSADTLIGFKYQIEDAALQRIFNGTEKFDLDKKVRTIQINESPDRKSFDVLSALYNSVVTLRNVLSLVIADKSAVKAVADTTINSNQYKVVSIEIGKRRIQNLGNGFDAMITKSNFIYKIIIDRNSYLPVEMLQKNDLNNDFIKTSFNNIEVNTNRPSETSWYYSTYANDYTPAANMAALQLLPNGSSAPEWKLEVYNQDQMISLNDLKGKVVLLDFWIKNCAPCIQSVPHLNELQNEFKDKNFKIISINSYDAKDDVAWFYNKHKIHYSVLLNGKSVAEKYGVSGYPTFFIVDKTGKVIYSKTGYGASVKSQLKQVIQRAL